MKIKKIGSMLLLGIITGSLLLQNENLFAANEKYPTSDTNTDKNGITMTNRATWVDETHVNNNYDANLEVTINGLKEKKVFNEPVDVQIVHDISTSMDYTCYSQNHYSFNYYKTIESAFSAEQLKDLKPEIETYLLDYLKGHEVTGKDNWISIAGKTDKDGKVFSKDAYLVPKNNFYMIDDPFYLDTKTLNMKDFEKRWFVIDDVVASVDAADNGGYPYWYQRYHASKDDTGKFHSLSVMDDPTYPTYVYYNEFDRKAAIKGNCKSYTATANKLIYNFSEQLYRANEDSHLAINSFTEKNTYSSKFTNDPELFKKELVNAFDSGSGQTNYEAGLLVGRDNLKNHDDEEGRKKILIFISDGRPNRSLDDEGNIIESSDMERLKAVAEEMKKEGNEIYTVGFCIDKWTNDTYLLPMATDENHSHFRTPDQLDKMVEIYDFMQDKIVEDTYIKAIVENTISQYYEVDKDKLPKDVTLIEKDEIQSDGSIKNVQKIRYMVNTNDLDTNGINTKVIPLILKEEYRKTNAYYPTNDEAKKGANALYANLDDSKQTINIKTPWLPVNAKPKTYRIDTEVVNGTISNSVTNIKSGENKIIKYSPNDGYKLKEIYIDDKLIDINNNGNAYHFNKIAKNYKIKVVYEKENTNTPSNPSNPSKPNTPSKKPETPKTGDTTMIALWFILATVSVGSLLFIIRKKRC